MMCLLCLVAAIKIFCSNFLPDLCGNYLISSTFIRTKDQLNIISIKNKYLFEYSVTTFGKVSTFKIIIQLKMKADPVSLPAPWQLCRHLSNTVLTS